MLNDRRSFGTLLQAARQQCRDSQTGRSLTLQGLANLISERLHTFNSPTDQTIRNWEKDVHHPNAADRKLLLAIVDALVSCAGLTDASKANDLLDGGGYAALNKDEQRTIFDGLEAEQEVASFIQADSHHGVPRCPLPNAMRLFGRTTVIDDLVGRLTGDGTDSVVISAVCGLPGVGKTDLLRVIGNEPHIIAHFKGGVLYAELGQTPDPAQIMRRWLTELGQDIPSMSDVETLAGVVRRALSKRLLLLIIDDVWESSLDVAKLLRECATITCRVLVSSRSAGIASEVAKGHLPLELMVLDEDSALALLSQHASTTVQSDTIGATKLVVALGKLPLALRLAGRLLANDRRSLQPCTILLQTWQTRLDELRGYEVRPGIINEQMSLETIIGMSYTALPNDTARSAAAALSVFGATPLDWDWDAMEAVWSSHDRITTALEDVLMSSGLLNYDAITRRYSLHQTIQAFLTQRADPSAYERHSA